MFWGLIMEPNKRYTQTVEKPFHISQAAMDTSTGDSEICQVMVVVDGKNFLVCTLQKNKTIQAPLDLYFKTGNVVSFLTNGKCNVHLTGYLDPEFDEEESDDEEEEEEAPELVPAKNKRKLDSSTESATKKLKQETKKQLQKQLVEDSDDSSEDEDGAVDLQRLLDGDVDSDENDDSFRPNSTAADSDEESGEEEEEEESAEEEVAEEETSAADTSKEETPQKLSKNQKRKLKKLQKAAAAEQPQTNGVEKKKAKKEQPEPKQKKAKEAEKPKTSPEKREKGKLSGGVSIEDLKVGSGPVAAAGKVVQVYYEGRLKQNNKMFDNCNKGPGFKFRLGSKEVISGWDVGVAGMKVGGKRKIICPPAMAYGAKGSPPVIPPNAHLVFEVELKNVK